MDEKVAAHAKLVSGVAYLHAKPGPVQEAQSARVLYELYFFQDFPSKKTGKSRLRCRRDTICLASSRGVSHELIHDIEGDGPSAGVVHPARILWICASE